jgi:hypothetical protein
MHFRMAFRLSRTGENASARGKGGGGIWTCLHVVVCLDLKSRDLVESVKYIYLTADLLIVD